MELKRKYPGKSPCGFLYPIQGKHPKPVANPSDLEWKEGASIPSFVGWEKEPLVPEEFAWTAMRVTYRASLSLSWRTDGYEQCGQTSDRQESGAAWLLEVQCKGKLLKDAMQSHGFDLEHYTGIAACTPTLHCLITHLHLQAPPWTSGTGNLAETNQLRIYNITASNELKPSSILPE